MHKLRLRLPVEADELEPIPFPKPGSLRPEDETEPSSDAERIQDLFDRVQRDLDRLSDEVDGVFHLPCSDDWPPSAA